MAQAPKDYKLIYAAEPTGSPLRMQCKRCSAAPGEKCRASFRGGPMDNYHAAREADFNILREAEAKMQQMNRDYGKAVAQ